MRPCCGARVLGRGNDITPFRGQKTDVDFSVRCRMGKRRRSSPVFMTTIDVENLGLARATEVVAKARALPRHWVLGRNTGEWKDVSWIKKGRVWLRIPGRLCEAMIEAPAASAGGMHEESIKCWASSLVGIETLIEEVADESSRL